MTIAHPARRLVMMAALAALAAPAAATAQAHVSIQLGLPAVLPPLVVVEPGVEVVQDFGEEVFFVDGWYWVRRDGWWYRAHDHRARWTYVEPRWVPGALVRIPPGRYRHWHGEYRHPYWHQEYRPLPWRHAPDRHHGWRELERHGWRENGQHGWQEHGRHGWREHGHDTWREPGYRHERGDHREGGRREWREARREPAGRHGHVHR